MDREHMDWERIGWRNMDWEHMDWERIAREEDMKSVLGVGVVGIAGFSEPMPHLDEFDLWLSLGTFYVRRRGLPFQLYYILFEYQ
jgi:hypothetical protein